MYQNIRNNILKSMIRLHLKVVVVFLQQIIKTAKRSTVFLSTGRIQFHVIHYRDPEQFPNSNHFSCLTACLVSVICCYGNDLRCQNTVLFDPTGEGRVLGGKLWKRFRGKLKTNLDFALKNQNTFFLLGCALIFKLLLPCGHLILWFVKGSWSPFSVVYHTLVNMNKSMTPFLALHLRSSSTILIELTSQILMK